VNHIKLLLLKRGNRYAIRLKDNDAAQRRNFAGLSWYPVNEEWPITAKFVPFPTPNKLVLDNIIGDQEEVENPAYVVFEKDGLGQKRKPVACTPCPAPSPHTQPAPLLRRRTACPSQFPLARRSIRVTTPYRASTNNF
jgi:hypothetical protein